MDYTPTPNPDPTGQSFNTFPQGYTQNTSTPSDIYNATAPGNAPQYHYGAPQSFFNPQYLEEQRKKMYERRQHEKAIKGLGTGTGLTLLFVLVFSYILSFLLILPTFNKLYENNLTFAGAFSIFYSAISVGGAFLIGSKFLRKTKPSVNIPFNPPKDKQKTLLLVLSGFGGCLIANYLTVFLRAFGEGIGIYSDYTALEDPSSTLDVIMIFIGSAIVPPLIEEFALRGVLMQNLRKYGDAFAIVTSAFVFGVFHGNAVQMPFAFLCGLVIGYAVIATESLWTGIIIHGLMNAMSAASSALIYYFDEYASNTFFYAGSAIGIVLGILAFIMYLTHYRSDKLSSNNGQMNDMPVFEKFVKFNSSPIMIIAIILYVIQAVSQLSTTPPTF